MRFGTGKVLGALAPSLILLALLAPAATAERVAPLKTSIERAQGGGATAAVPVNMLTINDLRGVDNRITVFIAPSGRLTLVAPEGLADPDGPSGTNCTLDNAGSGATMATQISCAPSYVQVIVGELGGGNDTFSAAPDLPLPIGAVIDGSRRPMSGGIGDDRVVSGAAADLLDGGLGKDTLLGLRGEDLLGGGGGKDKLAGGGGPDGLFGGGGPDKLAGGGNRDLCNGGVGPDRGKACEIVQSVP
jgi:RTX calcium-binding nonapeptide repeat (4 copies)